MRNSTDPALYATSVNLKCVVCGEDAWVFAVKDEPVCIRVECKHVIAQKQKMPTPAYRQFFTLRSQQILFTIEQQRKKKAQLEKKRRKEEAAYVAFMRHLLTDEKSNGAAFYPHVMLSKNIRTVVPVSEKRIDVFRDFLVNLAEEAFSHPTDSEPEAEMDSEDRFMPPEPQVIEASACGVCAGTCCMNGQNHAYLSKETFAPYPNHGVDGIVRAYMEHLPDFTYEDSCIFHTPTGCFLPRNLRSNTCNDFKCDALMLMNKTIRQSDQIKGFLIVEKMPENWRETLAHGIDDRLFPSLVHLNPGNTACFT